MKSEAQLQSAKLDLERYQNLVKDEAISRQTVEQQVATVAQLSAAVRADEATIAAAKVDHSFTRIVAPITGRIGFRRVDAGNVVRPSDPEGLLTITQLAPISIVFTLPQEMLSQIQPLLLETGGAPVTAFDREAGSELAAGKLSMIDNAIDTNTGTFRLRAEFTNENHPLWPGQFATVELRTGVSRDVVVVPARAVQRGLDGPYVYRVVEGKAELVRVEIAFEDDEVAIVREGLARGETVISDGHSRVKPGAKVKVIEPPKGPGLGRPVT
jgi:RND family efflux transporter MFP subunit